MSNRGLRRLHVRLLREQHPLKREAAAAPAVSGTLQAIAACESHGNPRAIGGGGAFRGMFQMTFRDLGRRRRPGDPAAAPEAEQYRRAALVYDRTAPASGRSAAADRHPGTAPFRAVRLRRLRGLPLSQRATGDSPLVAVRSCGHGSRSAARAVPGLREKAYLNAGTCGPLPEAAVAGRAAQTCRAAADEGRATARYERFIETRQQLRAAYAERLRRAARRTWR